MEDFEEIMNFLFPSRPTQPTISTYVGQYFLNGIQVRYGHRFDAVSAEFARATTLEDKMKVAAKLGSHFGPDTFYENRYSEVKDRTNFKTRERSEEFRNNGNKMFRKGNKEMALQLYTKSIAKAPFDSNELIFAYANRSAVLHSMKKCRESLVDIERALSHGYPRDKSFKLLLREMQCHRDLKNSEEMTASFEKASNLLQSLSGLTDEERDVQVQKLKSEMQLSGRIVLTEEVIFPMQSWSYGSKLGGSGCLQCSQGRHLVATKDINIGDVLLIAENIAVTVMDEHKYDHCAHCHKLCYNLLPCPNCVWVMLCSVEFQTEADQSYHTAECIPNSRFRHVENKAPFSVKDVFDRLFRLFAMIGIDNLQPYLKYARTSFSEGCLTNEAK